MKTALLWMFYCASVSALLMMGAMALEAAARAMGRATRWYWTIALLGSLVLPIASYLRPVHVPAIASGFSMTPLNAPVNAGPVTSASAATPAAPRHTGLALWATSSLLVLGFIIFSYIRLFIARRTWTRTEVNGVEVWLSEDVGPAALGVARADIVLPRWVLSLEARALALMMLHEREHLRAWDPRLMLASIVLAGTLPWNPFGWLMLRRLRLAIEIDCDARVLKTEPDPARYGAVLLEVGRRRASGTFALSTFAEPRSQLELRIRRMAERPQGQRMLRAAALCGIALMSAGGAYATHAPLHGRIVVDMPAATDQPAADKVPIDRTTMHSPRAVTDTNPPRLNLKNLHQAILDNYPAALRDAGVAGQADVLVFVGPAGTVQKQVIERSSGNEALDAAALRVAHSMLFVPAVHAGRRVSMWVRTFVSFGDEQAAGMYNAPPTALPRDGKFQPLSVPSIPNTPTTTTQQPTVQRKATTITAAGYYVTDSVAYIRKANGVVDTMHFVRNPQETPSLSIVPAPATQVEVQPVLLNGPEIQAAIVKAYPPLLRDAGIGGTPVVWMYLDTTGRVTKMMVNKSSGYDALDLAAVHLAPLYRFRPARDGDVAAPVWISVSVRFTPTPNPLVPRDQGNVTQSAPPTPLQSSSSIVVTGDRGATPRVMQSAIPTAQEDSGAPFIKPTDVQPKLLNRDEVAAAVSRNYPAVLRDAGIGGTVKVWFYINEKGIVTKRLINKGSGYDALDAGALSVAGVMRFSPAQLKNEATAVWVSIDIQFRVK